MLMHGLTRCARGSAALALLLCLLMVGIVVGKSQLQAGSVSPGPASRAFSAVNMASAPAAAAKDAQPVAPGGPVVGHDLRHDTSPPLSSMPAVRPGPAGNRVLPDRGELRQTVARPWVQDPVVQSSMSDASSPGMPSLRASFEGIYNYWGYYPPDTNGDVGPNHYVQIVNVGFQVFSKTGASLYGPANISTLFKGLGGVCETRDDGDPIALYDPLADRWLISQFAVPGGADGYHQCVAVSASGDPTGRYYRYDFLINNPLFNDYPHFGVWPDGYYVGFNMYGKVSFSGAEPAVLDRAAMLAGRQASFQSFPPQHGLSSLLPADFDGRLLPPSGEPEVFADVDLNGQPNLNLYNFHVDWAHPSNSTFTLAARLPVADLNAPCTGSHYNCVSQPGTAQGLDSLGDRLMYRLQYRNFGDHQALVTNHTVDIGTSQAPNTGIRWYELRSPSGSPFTPSLYQQGTFAPDANNRWMGSVALDHSGNLAAGYSVSSQTVYPGLRYAGRLATDPLGTLPQGEANLISGSGSQTGTDGRWGDYSMLAVDPSDDCTFWFTSEYLSQTGERNWRTRIGSFKFPGCNAGPLPTPTSGPRPTNTPRPSPTPTVCPGGATYVGSITSSDPVAAGRLNRDDTPSTCATPKTCPGQFDTVARHYDTYTYRNTGSSPKCVTVTINEACGNNALLSAAYLGTFDPTNLCANYLADMGIAGPTFSYSFTAPANSTVVVMVEENSANIGCSSYTLQISPCAP